MRLCTLFLLALLPWMVFATGAAMIVKPEDQAALLTISNKDFVLGDKKKAKIIIFEYSSLSCPHCSDFHKNVMPKLKENYIDSGKILYVYRSFPTNRSALAATKLALCVDKSEFFRMLNTLFETQNSWAFDEKYIVSLENIARLAGVSTEQFQRCQNDKAMEEAILKETQEIAAKMLIRATPTFFINGEEVSGDKPYKVFQTIIDKKLAETNNSNS